MTAFFLARNIKENMIKAFVEAMQLSRSKTVRSLLYLDCRRDIEETAQMRQNITTENPELCEVIIPVYRDRERGDYL